LFHKNCIFMTSFHSDLVAIILWRRVITKNYHSLALVVYMMEYLDNKALSGSSSQHVFVFRKPKERSVTRSLKSLQTNEMLTGKSSAFLFSQSRSIFSWLWHISENHYLFWPLKIALEARTTYNSYGSRSENHQSRQVGNGYCAADGEVSTYGERNNLNCRLHETRACITKLVANLWSAAQN